MSDNLPKEIYLRPAWRSQWRSFALLIVMTGIYVVSYNPWVHLILPFVIAIIIFKILVHRFGRYYMIGPKGVELHVGIISRDFSRIEYRHIRGAHMRQTIMQRIMGLGQIKIVTSGTDEYLLIEDIKKPFRYTDIIKSRLMEL